MKKKVISAAVVLLMIINIIIIINPFEHFRLIDRYIRYNVSSELSMLSQIFDELEQDLLVDEAYKTIEISEMHEMIKDTRYKILLIDMSIGKLELLNENYDFDLYELSKYIDELESMLNMNKRPSDAQMEKLIAITDIMSKYSSSTVLSYYEDDGTGFTRLELPEDTKALFDELNNLNNMQKTTEEN